MKHTRKISCTPAVAQQTSIQVKLDFMTGLTGQLVTLAGFAGNVGSELIAFGGAVAASLTGVGNSVGSSLITFVGTLGTSVTTASTTLGTGIINLASGLITGIGTTAADASQTFNALGPWFNTKGAGSI